MAYRGPTTIYAAHQMLKNKQLKAVDLLEEVYK